MRIIDHRASKSYAIAPRSLTCYSPLPESKVLVVNSLGALESIISMSRAAKSRFHSGLAAAKAISEVPINALSTTIIGAGRVGAAFALAMDRVGYQIELVAARRLVSARRVVRLLGAEAFAISAPQLRQPTSDQLKRVLGSSIILISTPDDEIESVVDLLTKLLIGEIGQSRMRSSRRVALHTSGALSSELLKPLKKAGFAIGSLHPLVSISEGQSGAELLSQAYFSVEGDALAKQVARSLVRKLGGRSFSISGREKALYHAAAVMAAPHLITLFDLALEMLSDCGLSRTEARKVLLPLVSSTLANLSVRDPAQALTGPFSRGDAATIRKHLSVIKSRPDVLDVYVSLGRSSLGLAQRQDKTNPGYLEIERLLTSAEENCKKLR